MKRAMLVGFGMLALMLMSGTPAPAGGGSASVVTVKGRLEKSAAGKAIVVLTLDIKPGWHLYANPVNNVDKTLQSGQVIVSAVGADATIAYPAGSPYVDSEGTKYSIYEKKVEIRAALDRVVDAANPATFTVKLQSCDKNTCLPGATVRVTVP